MNTLVRDCGGDADEVRGGLLRNPGLGETPESGQFCGGRMSHRMGIPNMIFGIAIDWRIEAVIHRDCSAGEALLSALCLSS